MPQQICPKCKQPVRETDIRCSHCNMRLIHVCPTCGNLNRFGEEKCSKCKTTLIKYCENCGSANMAHAKTCRKCSSPLAVEEDRIIPFESRLAFQPKLKESISLQSEKIQEKFAKKLSRTASSSQNVIIEEHNLHEYRQEAVPQNTTVSASEQNTDSAVTGDNIRNNEEMLAKEEQLNTIYPEADSDTEIDTETADVQNEVPQEETPYEALPEQEEDAELTREDVNEDEIVCLDDFDQMIAHLSNIIKTPNNAVITGICAEEGMGKSTVIKTFAESLANDGYIPVISENSDLLKVSPYGCIRDSILKLLTLPDVHPDLASFYSDDTKQLFTQNFPTLNEGEIENFMNFLYPSMQGNFADINKNKEVTHNLLEKIFKSIIDNNNIVFMIDNFELTDNASFDFI